MSAANAGQSEPTGADRLTRAHVFLALKRFGIAPDTIADREGLSRALVYRMIAEAARADAGATAAPSSADPVVAAPVAVAPVAPRKLGEAALLRRAWITMLGHGGLSKADAEAKLFWLRAVLAINAEGDGCALLFEECGYDNGEDFADCFGGTPEALAYLLRRKVLLDLDGAGIGLPPKLGLLRGEKPGGRLAPGAPGRAPDPRQSGMLLSIAGGRSDSATESTAKPDSVDSESTKPAEFRHSESTQSPNSVDSAGLARPTATTTEERKTALKGGSTAPRATGSVDSESTEGVDSGAPSEQSGERYLAWLAVQLAGESGTALTPKVLGMVQGWLTEGEGRGLNRLATEQLVFAVAGRMRTRPSFPPDAAVEYYNAAILEALRKAGRARPPPDTG